MIIHNSIPFPVICDFPAVLDSSHDYPMPWMVEMYASIVCRCRRINYTKSALSLTIYRAMRVNLPFSSGIWWRMEIFHDLKQEINSSIPVLHLLNLEMSSYLVLFVCQYRCFFCIYELSSQNSISKEGVLFKGLQVYAILYCIHTNCSQFIHLTLVLLKLSCI